MGIYVYSNSTDKPLIIAANDIVEADGVYTKLTGKKATSTTVSSLVAVFQDLSKQVTKLDGGTKNPYNPLKYPRKDLEMISHGAKKVTVSISTVTGNRMYWGAFNNIVLKSGNIHFGTFYTITEMFNFIGQNIKGIPSEHVSVAAT